MQQPLVSVIIPNYNHAKYLSQRIESVLNQSYKNIEIIILDDCSTDNSIEVIKKYCEQNPTIQFYPNLQNSGTTFKQWNKGVSLAKGKYIWIAESDDIAHSTELLMVLVNKLEQNSSVGIAYCQSIRIDKDGIEHSTLLGYTSKFKPNIWEHDFFMEGIKFIDNYMFFMSAIPNASAVVFKKSIFEQVDAADETLKVSGDWFVWLKMLTISSVAFIAEPHNSFRFHNNNARTAISEKAWIKEDIVVMQKFQKKYNLLTNNFYIAFDFLLERAIVEVLKFPDKVFFQQIYDITKDIFGSNQIAEKLLKQQAAKTSYISFCSEQIQYYNWLAGAKGLLYVGYVKQDMWYYIKSILYWTVRRKKK
jgi:glycosyltransferase involved in cell wall biosynthesis